MAPNTLPSAPPETGAATPGANPLHWLEDFIGRHFREMPAPIRWVTYLLIVLTLVNLLSAPGVLRGTLVLPTQHKAGYSVQADSSQAVTIDDGSWLVTTEGVWPFAYGKTVTIADPGGHTAEVWVTMPIPLLSSLTGTSRVRIRCADLTLTGCESLRTAWWTPEPVAYAAEAQKPVATQAPAAPTANQVLVEIAQLKIDKADGGGKDFGELYFEIAVNGQPIEPPGIPTRRFKNNYLIINNHSTTQFDNLRFRLGQAARLPARLDIRLYDRDDCVLCFVGGKNDVVGVFSYQITAADLGREVTLATGRGIKAGYPSNNSTLLLRASLQP